MKDYRVAVTWTEVTRENGKEVHLQYGQIYPVVDLESGKVLRARALQNNGFAPETAHDVQIELLGEGVSGEPLATPAQNAKGLHDAYAVLAGCKGPLARDLGKTAGEQRQRQVA